MSRRCTSRSVPARSFRQFASPSFSRFAPMAMRYSYLPWCGLEQATDYVLVAPERRVCAGHKRRGNTAMTMTDDVRAVTADLLEAVRAAARQEQFLEIVSPQEARTRFAAHIAFAPLDPEPVTLADALGRVLAANVTAPIDVPPFD